MTCQIVKTEVNPGSVTITLENGVQVCISSNNGYLHLHFSGTEGHIVACGSLFAPQLPQLQVANYIDVGYTARPRE